jgi:transmembrane sensor
MPRNLVVSWSFRLKKDAGHLCGGFLADRTGCEVSFMSDSHGGDKAWQTAVEWIIRKQASPLDTASENELLAWLEEDPANRAAYEEASNVWLLTGLVPRTDEPESDE